jgi:hypothetical protein
MKVLSLEVHNVQRISDVRFDLKGQNLFLVGGRNSNGKSSALIGLLMAICGRSGMDNYPEIALKNGEDEGWVKVGLSGETENLHQPGGMTVDLKLIRHPRKGVVVEEFQILDTDGDAAPEPRTLLKQLFTMRAFDPLEFQRMKPKDRKALLERLLGLDFTEDRAEYKRLFEKRTDVNRDFTKAKAQLDGMAQHPDVAETSASDLLAEADRRRSVNAANAEERRKLNGVQNQVADIGVSIGNVNTEIQDLENKIESLKIRRANLERDKVAAVAKVAEQQELIAKLVDEDVTEIDGKIKNIDKNNEMARANQRRKEVFAKWQDLGKQADALTEKMDNIKTANEKKIQDAEFPVPGMSMDAEGVLLDGLPFEQASTKQRIIASTKVGIALNPTLRLMVSQDGGSLDQEAIAELDALLVEHDFQMIVEIVTRTEADDDLCSVVIKDGKVAKTNTRKVAPSLFTADTESQNAASSVSA